MDTQRRRRTRFLGCESLESREMMAAGAVGAQSASQLTRVQLLESEQHVARPIVDQYVVKLAAHDQGDQADAKSALAAQEIAAPLAGSAAANAPLFEQATTGQTTPAAAPTSIPLASPRKVYVMQGVNSFNIDDASLAKADGIVVRTTWSSIEPEPGVFNLRYLRKQLQRAERMDKLVQIKLLAGDDAPTWLTSLGSKVYQFDGGQIPLPWGQVYQGRYIDMVNYLKNNLDFSNVTHFHSIGADSAEWHYKQFNNGGFYTQTRYTDELMASAHVQIVGKLVQALPQIIIVCDLGDHEKAWTGQAISQINAYYKGHVGFQIGSLDAATPLTYTGFRRIAAAADAGFHAGFEMVSPSQTKDGTPVERFGGPFQDAIAKADTTSVQWLLVYENDLDEFSTP